MALWKEPTKPTSSSPEIANLPGLNAAPPEPRLAEPPVTHVANTSASNPNLSGREKSKSESLIAPDIAIEGKIEGAGHVRIAGAFKGDVNVRGDLTIEPSAKVTGSVRANKVVIAGELIGNIEAALQVELMAGGALTGDVKAGTLTVAAGSRMRGHAEFGWEDSNASAPNVENAHKNSHRNGAGNGVAA